ncbi:MAG: hypothetical protein WAK16_07335 [Candidatus Cybelea sp.]
MKSSSFFVFAGAAIAALFALAGTPANRLAAVAATPPPTPPPLSAPATEAPAEPSGSSLPTPSAAMPLGGSMASPAPATTATPSPPPNARKGLNGVWEVQIQHPSTTEYTHFIIQQQGGSLTGTYLDAARKKYPLVGSVDGTDVRLIVSLPNGTTILMEGRLDGTSDMLGMFTNSNGQVPFTATYRAKEKWIENVSPSPGGISQPGGYTPP